MQKDSFDLYCLACNIMVATRVIARGFGNYRNDAISPLGETETEYHGDHYSVALCGRCSSPFLVREALYGIPGEFETVTDETVLFPTSAKLQLDNIPEPVARALSQAHRSFSTSSYDACALMCRRAVEALCKNLGANGSNLASRVADLQATGHIDAKLVKWAHGVRLLGNDAAHDIDATVTAEDARDILDLTEALLLYVFTLDTKFRAFEVRRKQRS